MERSFILVGFLLLGPLFTATPSARAQGNTQVIDSLPAQLRSGVNYVLDRDLEWNQAYGAAITVTGGFGPSIDLNGHTIRASAQNAGYIGYFIRNQAFRIQNSVFGTGYGANAAFVTIFNGTIEGFDDGIVADNTQDQRGIFLRVENVTFRDCGIGIDQPGYSGAGGLRTLLGPDGKVAAPSRPNLQIAGCRFEGIGRTSAGEARAVQIGVRTANLYNFTGNVFSSRAPLTGGETGVQANNARYVTFEGNTFAGLSFGIAFVGERSPGTNTYQDNSFSGVTNPVSGGGVDAGGNQILP